MSADVRTREQISYNMSRVRRSGSEIERTLGSALWSAGVRYRKQYKRVPGCPDFAIPRAKVAIFCDSTFWHGRDWPDAARAIKSNRTFWINKIEGNIARDLAVNKQLCQIGWRVLRFWDVDILQSTGRCVRRVRQVLERQQRECATCHEP